MNKNQEKQIAIESTRILLTLINKRFKSPHLRETKITGIGYLAIKLLAGMIREMIEHEVETESDCDGIYEHLSDLLNSIRFVAEYPDGRLEQITEEHLMMALKWLNENGFITISTDNPDDWDYDTWASISDWQRVVAHA